MSRSILKKPMFYGADAETFESASILRREMTLPERILWKRLRNRNLFKVKFRRQHPIDIFIVDFYCHELKLVIEVDGEVHNDRDIAEYDLGRSAELEKYGIKILRFSNDQIFTDITLVLNKIHKKITELTPLQGGRGVDTVVL